MLLVVVFVRFARCFMMLLFSLYCRCRLLLVSVRVGLDAVILYTQKALESLGLMCPTGFEYFVN